MAEDLNHPPLIDGRFYDYASIPKIMYQKFVWEHVRKYLQSLLSLKGLFFSWNNTKEGPSAWPLDQTCELH